MLIDRAGTESHNFTLPLSLIEKAIRRELSEEELNALELDAPGEYLLSTLTDGKNGSLEEWNTLYDNGGFGVCDEEFIWGLGMAKKDAIMARDRVKGIDEEQWDE